jgi:hypothetical protein
MMVEFLECLKARSVIQDATNIFQNFGRVFNDVYLLIQHRKNNCNNHIK